MMGDHRRVGHCAGTGAWTREVEGASEPSSGSIAETVVAGTVVAAVAVVENSEVGDRCCRSCDLLVQS